MAAIKAEEVRIPRRAREAVAHHEEVVVFNRERPAYVIVHIRHFSRIPGLSVMPVQLV